MVDTNIEILTIFWYNFKLSQKAYKIQKEKEIKK